MIFVKCVKRTNLSKEEKMKKLSQILKALALAILLMIGMWSADGGGCLQCKNSNSRKEHGATYA